MFKIVLLLACIPALALAAVGQCSAGEFPLEIRNNICDLDAASCHIQIGELINFEMDFVAQSDAAEVTPKVLAKISIITTEIALSDEAKIGCDSIFNAAGELACPLTAGETYTYKMDLLLESFPIPSPQKLTVEISLNSEVKEACFNFAADI